MFAVSIIFGLPMLLLLANFVGFFGRFQNKGIKFTFSILSPFLFLILVPLGIDIGSTFFFLGLVICVFVGIVLFVINLIKLTYAVIKKNGLATTHLVKMIQPILLIFMFAAVTTLNQLSLKEADKFAIEMGQKVQKTCIEQKKCPNKIDGWRNGVIFQYSSWGSQKQLQYWPYGDTFILTVHHDIDTPYKVEGGVSKPFKYGF